MGEIAMRTPLTFILLGLIWAVSAQAQEDGPAAPLHCSGNEPFWSLDLDGAQGVLKRPGAEQVEETRYQGAWTGLGFLTPPARVWRGEADGDVLTAVVREEACQDTMKDGPALSHSVIVSTGAVTAAGCCRLAPVEEQSEDDAPVSKPDAPRYRAHDWSVRIRDYLPAMRLCVFDSGLGIDRVEIAWPMNKGLVGVRMRAADGSRHDCIAEQTGGEIIMLDPVSEEAERMKGEADPAFYPASEQQPMIEGGVLEQLVDGDGVFQGWLYYPPATVGPVSALVGTWLLEDIGGRGVIDYLNTPLSITTEGKVSGHAGCNRFFGTARIDGPAVTLGPTMSTKMACPPAIMDQEQRFFSALSKIEQWRIENGLLMLMDGGGETLLRFAPAE